MSTVIRCLCLPLVIATGLLGIEITGKVTSVSRETVTIDADDAKAQARAGDSVVIYFQIPGLDDLAMVGSGQVVSAQGGRIVARIDQRTGSLAVGQIAKVQATGKPAPPARTAPVAKTKTGTQVLHFNKQWLGWLATDAFKSAGVRWTLGEGDPRIDAPEPNMIVPSGRRRLLVLVGGPVTSLALEFTPPVKRFSLTRIGTEGGASIPTWTLEAFDARGKKVGAAGEEHGLPPQPQRFSVAGDGIVRAVLRTDNRFGEGTWATWNSLPVVEFEIER
jgi:RNase P/RNase MRP subunit p29